MVLSRDGRQNQLEIQIADKIVFIIILQMLLRISLAIKIKLTVLMSDLVRTSLFNVMLNNVVEYTYAWGIPFQT